MDGTPEKPPKPNDSSGESKPNNPDFGSLTKQDLSTLRQQDSMINIPTEFPNANQLLSQLDNSGSPSSDGSGTNGDDTQSGDREPGDARGESGPQSESETENEFDFFSDDFEPMEPDDKDKREDPPWTPENRKGEGDAGKDGKEEIPYQNPEKKEQFFNALKEADKITDPTEKTKALKSAIANLVGTTADKFGGLTGPGSILVEGKDGQSAFIGYNHGFSNGVYLQSGDSAHFLDLTKDANARVEIGKDGKPTFDPPNLSDQRQRGLMSGAAIALNQAGHKYATAMRENSQQVKEFGPHLQKFVEGHEKFDMASTEAQHGTKDHPHTAYLKSVSADKFDKMGDPKRALEKWQEAVAIQEKLFPGHKDLQFNKEFIAQRQKELNPPPGEKPGRTKTVSLVSSTRPPWTPSPFRNIR